MAKIPYYGVFSKDLEVALKYNPPGDWPGWATTGIKDTVAHAVIKKGRYLPKDFNKWHLKNREGLPVAHVAAAYGKLPPGFNKWKLRDKDGRTVAHVAAATGTLPPTYTDWEEKDLNGVTVAEAAAEVGRLPTDPQAWFVKTRDGITVFELYVNLLALAEPTAFG